MSPAKPETTCPICGEPTGLIAGGKPFCVYCENQRTKHAAVDSGRYREPKMKYKVQCNECGSEFWLDGERDPETDVLVFRDKVAAGTQCQCKADLKVVEEADDLYA